MAKLINVSASTEERNDVREREGGFTTESFLNDDCLVWYDIPVGRRNRHPDFVIDPENGLVFLEVKDWTISTLREANQEQVTLETDGLLEIRNKSAGTGSSLCLDTVNALPADPCLRQNDGQYKGRLNLGPSVWCGKFTRITRQQLKTLAGK